MKTVIAMNDSDEIVKEFVVESYENLDRLDRDLIALEKNPNDREILASVFRTIHTIKGTCGFLAFDKLGAVAHVGENLLGRLRDGQLALDREITTALLAMVDAIRQMLASVESAGVEGERDDSVLIANLTRLQRGSEAPAKTEAPAQLKTAVAAVGAKLNERTAAIGKAPSPQVEAAKPVVPAPPRETAATTAQSDSGEAQRAPQPGRGGQSSGVSVSDSTIRLEVGLLDQLMNLVGELVLARNQVLQFANSSEDGGLLATSQRLNLITTELQEGVMKTRMQPIGNIWSKLPRTVRDLALACGKQVRVEMEGKETELDKTLIEAIKDPLTHIVRNSVDHGIETPEIREAAGKNPEGCLALRAFHEGGQVNIEIADDGAGLDQERIRSKAVQKGLITADQVARLSDREIVNLVFLPGFSTAEKITNVSGRGVGMDVVKTHIEKIGGTVELQSRPGRGVLVRMKIPLTLAIIPALTVTSGGERYAIPQVSLMELVRVESGGNRQRIEMIHGAPVYRLRGRLLPLVYLNRELGAGSGAAAPPNQPENVQANFAVNIVVLEAEGRQFGLVVDEINDTQEIVVKPLSKHLKNISVYAGATIMGDGKVALILDVVGVAARGGILAEGREHAAAQAADAAEKGAGDKQKLVLFTGRAGAQMAVPLQLLARLENIPGEQVERAGNQWVTQYRGQILPLIRVSHALEERRRAAGGDTLKLPTTDMLQVLVLESEQQSFGLVVNQILDIVESALQPQSPATRAGVLFSSVVAERVTELLDVPSLLRTRETYEPAEFPPPESRDMNAEHVNADRAES
jgi:two-component system, chemotaxis family, sensor kinase CheA